MAHDNSGLNRDTGVYTAAVDVCVLSLNSDDRCFLHLMPGLALKPICCNV